MEHKHLFATSVDWAIGTIIVATGVKASVEHRDANTALGIASGLGMKLELQTPDGPVIVWCPARLAHGLASNAGFSWFDKNNKGVDVDAWTTALAKSLELPPDHCLVLACWGQIESSGSKADAWDIRATVAKGYPNEIEEDAYASLAQVFTRRAQIDRARGVLEAQRAAPALDGPVRGKIQ